MHRATNSETNTNSSDEKENSFVCLFDRGFN